MCCEDSPASLLPLTRTPRRVCFSLCVYSNHQSSSKKSIRALQSDPRHTWLLLVLLSSSRWSIDGMPSPKFPSVSGQMHTCAPVSQNACISLSFVQVQCTAVNFESTARFDKMLAIGVVPQCARQSEISFGCSSTCM